MFYVRVEAVTVTARRGSVFSAWYDADSVADAVRLGLEEFHGVHDGAHGEPITYGITVATEASPRRSMVGSKPLPVKGLSE